MRNRSVRLLSGVSALAVLAASSLAGQANAAATITGPQTTPSYTNAQTDSVTISTDATLMPNGAGVSFFNGISMSNAAAALTISDSVLVGDLVNTGTIASTAGNALNILLDSQIGGLISNAGLIDGSVVGISIVDDSTIGGIDNTGDIIGGATGILLGDDSEIVAGITNSGSISGGSGIRVNDPQAELWGGIHNETGGLISGSTNAAISLTGAIYQGGITNAGTISGLSSSTAIEITSGAFTGDIVNSGTIIANGPSVIAIAASAGTFNGNITNSGRILAEGLSATGVSISGTTDFNGSITNQATGVIRAAESAITISNTTFDGDITNRGQITSLSGVAINVSTPAFTGDITNQASGTITGNSTGIVITSTLFTGDITNSGTIIGTTGDGVLINATTFAGDFSNSGEVNGNDNGLRLTGAAFNGDVSNSGLIQGGNAALVVDLGTTVNGDISNTGTITSTGLDAVSVAGSVTGDFDNHANAKITGARDGIVITGSVAGGITNSGTIIGVTGAAINLSGTTAHTVNQVAGLLRGGNGATTGTALDLTNTVADTVNASGGVIDGDIIGDGTNVDDLALSPTTKVVYLRGTASNLDQVTMTGDGTAFLGAASRGATGTNAPGVTIGARDLTMGGEGSLYIDDDTVITLTHNYAQSDGTLEYFLTPDVTTHGAINAANNAALGGRIAAYIDPQAFALAGGDTFTYNNVITGTTSGTFTNASAIDINSLFFDAIADVNAGDVDIILTRLAFSDVITLDGLTRNQARIGAALEAIYGAGAYSPDFEDLYAYLFGLPAGSEEDVHHLYDELAGAEHADVQEVALRSSHAFDDTIGRRLQGLRSSQQQQHANGIGLRRYAEADQVISSDAMPANENVGLRGSQDFAIWAEGYGAWTNADGDAEAAGYDQDTGGFSGGVDFAINHNWRAGAALGVSTSNVSFATHGDEADLDAFHAALYAALESGEFYADAVLSFASHEAETTRELDLGFGTFVADADYKAKSWGLHAETGWTARLGAASIEPFAAIAYSLLSTEDFAETGAGAYNLVVGSRTADTLATSLGARFSGTWSDGGVSLTPRLEVAWRHEFLDERQSFQAAFQEDPATRFQIVSSALARDSAVVKAGVDAEVEQGVVLFVGYNGLLNGSANTHGASAGVRANW